MNKYSIECRLDGNLSFDDICERMKYMDTDFILDASHFSTTSFVNTENTKFGLQIKHKRDEHYSCYINFEGTNADGQVCLKYSGHDLDGDMFNILSDFVQKAGGTIIENRGDNQVIATYKAKGFDLIQIAEDRTSEFKTKIDNIIASYSYLGDEVPDSENLLDNFYHSQLEMLKMQDKKQSLKKSIGNDFE